MGAHASLSAPAYEGWLRSATVRVVTADARAQAAARRLVDAELSRVDLDEAEPTMLMPEGVEPDVGRVARAWAADRCAAVVADVLGVGVLVGLGGDIATAGPAGGGAWQVLVADDELGKRGALVAIPTGLAVATSPSMASPSLVRATVVAPDCLSAAVWSAVATTGGTGVDHLLERGLPGRLVDVEGTVTYLGGWPEDAEVGAESVQP